MSAFLTISFKLHNPSTRKRNALLSAMRLATESRAALYKAGEQRLVSLFAIAKDIRPAERKKLVNTTMAELAKDRASFGVNGQTMNAALRDGVLRDVKALLVSRLGLLAEHDEQAGAANLLSCSSGLEEGLELLKSSITEEECNTARDLMSRRARNAYRPLSFVRWRLNDGFKILDDAGQWRVWLPIGDKPVLSSRPIADIRTGELLKVPRTPGILVPLEFGERHQARIIRQGVPRSATLRFDANTGDFYFNVAVEIETPLIEYSNAVVGVDRGIEVVAAFAVKAGNEVLETGMIDGCSIRAIQRKHERKLQASQKAGRRIRINWRKYNKHVVHEAANCIVEAAKHHRARVVLEDLNAISNGPHRRKKMNAIRRHGERNLNRQLSRAVYADLERVLTYKLALSGLPAPKKVNPAGTSITCPKCGHKDKENRPARSEFKCVACGHQSHADINAAINISSRGQKFFAGGQRQQQKSGAIVPPRATSSCVYDDSSIVACANTGAKHVTQVPKTAELFVGAEPNGATTVCKSGIS